MLSPSRDIRVWMGSWESSGRGAGSGSPPTRSGAGHEPGQGTRPAPRLGLGEAPERLLCPQVPLGLRGAVAAPGGRGGRSGGWAQAGHRGARKTGNSQQDMRTNCIPMRTVCNGAQTGWVISNPAGFQDLTGQSPERPRGGQAGPALSWDWRPPKVPPSVNGPVILPCLQRVPERLDELTRRMYDSLQLSWSGKIWPSQREKEKKLNRGAGRK